MEASPIIALTQGDPAGIGPEIIVKTFQDEALFTMNTQDSGRWRCQNGC